MKMTAAIVTGFAIVAVMQQAREEENSVTLSSRHRIGNSMIDPVKAIRITHIRAASRLNPA